VRRFPFVVLYVIESDGIHVMADRLSRGQAPNTCFAAVFDAWLPI